MNRLFPTLMVSLVLTANPAAAADLSLAEAVGSALESNRSVAAATELVPQARAGRDKAWAYVQPSIRLGIQYRINDREISFDPSESFGDTGGLTDAFEGLYGNIGIIYGSLFENGMLDGDDCQEIAEVNGFEDCAELTELLGSGDGLGAPDTGSDEPADPVVIQQKEQFFVNADVQWPISPRVIPLVRAGTMQVDAARAQVAATREQIIAAVIQLYAAAYQAQEGVVVLEGQVELALAFQRDTEVLKAAGLLTEDAVLRSRVEVARIQLQLTQVRQQEATARRALGLMMATDSPPDQQLVALNAVEVGEVDLETARAEALTRPDRAIAASQALAAKELVVDSALQFLPTFALAGSWNWSNASSGFDSNQSSWFIGFGASMPLWDGGLMIHGAREAASRRRQAALQLDALTEQVDVEVLDAHGAWQSGREALPVAEAEQTLAAEMYRLVQVRYAAGDARQIEVLDARAALQRAELTLLQQRVGLQLRSMELLQATGKLRQWAAGQ